MTGPSPPDKACDVHFIFIFAQVCGEGAENTSTRRILTAYEYEIIITILILNYSYGIFRPEMQRIRTILVSYVASALFGSSYSWPMKNSHDEDRV